MRAVCLGWLLSWSWGCAFMGPSCLNRQESGPVTTIVADLAAGQVVSHRVRYETEGSQNDVAISWLGQSAERGLRIQVYATRLACTDFRLPPASGDDACAPLASGGFLDGHLVTPLTITHGRGNPDVLGSPAEYKLWVIGDPVLGTRYTLAITWFFGPDC